MVESVRGNGTAAARDGKVLFFLRSLDYGGAERQLVTLVRELHRRGRPVTVAVFYGGTPLEVDLERSGVPVRSLRKRGRWDVLPFLLRLLRLLRQERPNTVHGYLDVPNVVAALVRPLAPPFRLVWGVRASGMELRHYDWLARASAWVECALSRTADVIIANSWAGFHDRAAQGFPASRMRVVPNGIDTDRFRPDGEQRRRVREEWGVRPEERLVGLIGRLDPMKDHPTFLRAAARVASRCPQVRFVCVGNGPDAYRAELVALAHELGIGGRVIWSPARSDMPAVFNALDLGCSASAFGEGFSNVLGEAMACGVPCVVTDVGDSARIVGDTGVVVPPRQPEQLADAVCHALSAPDLPERGCAARQRIEDRFSVQRLVEDTEGLLWGMG